jgi:hypothetical protein
LNWGLGIGDWGLGIGPNPQSPIPNPQSPIYSIIFLIIILLFNYYKLMSISTNYKFALSIILGIIFISICTVNSQSISYFNSISYIPQPGPTNSNSILQIVLPYPDEDLDLLKSYSQKLVCNRITYDYLNDLNTLVETNYVSKVIKYPANTVTAALPPLGLGLRFKFDCQSQLINDGILGLISKNAVINSFKPPNKITGINMSYDEPEKELVISFTKPTENGSTINLIEFFMKGKNNRYTRVCVITDSNLTSCRVDMFKILDGPLYLENGDLLKVYGVASNEAGTSDRSYLLATLITVIGLAQFLHYLLHLHYLLQKTISFLQWSLLLI